MSLCINVCGFSGYQFAGLEYGVECHCGNRINSPQAPEEDCNLVCRSERGYPCGGVSRLSIYKVEEQPPGHRKCESYSLKDKEVLVDKLRHKKKKNRSFNQKGTVPINRFTSSFIA